MRRQLEKIMNVFYCQKIPATRAYMVPLVGQKRKQLQCVIQIQWNGIPSIWPFSSSKSNQELLPSATSFLRITSSGWFQNRNAWAINK
ncbi:unnamed protein product, partial [Vitis vinifera]|uniref:Uncharacterized protein n=1 Tax=Vitis vinifera TaxID=29760 RepID=D7SUH0_VITVI